MKRILGYSETEFPEVGETLLRQEPSHCVTGQIERFSTVLVTEVREQFPPSGFAAFGKEAALSVLKIVRIIPSTLEC
jgi:hypothetical protein